MSGKKHPPRNDGNTTNQSMYRYYIVCVLGIIFALPALGLIVLAFRLPITISGIGYLLAYSLAVAGLISAPWNKKYYLVTLAGIFMIGFVAGVRLLLAIQQKASRNLSMITLPQGTRTHWISYLIDEQDTLIFGEALFHYVGGDSLDEHENLSSAMAKAYAEMRAAHGVFPSPVVSTYLGLQRPAGFDTLIIQPEIVRHPDTAVIFLHGYMGNVTAQCWQIAQAVNSFGAITLCPSTEWTGQWWQPPGKAILKASFDYLREQGIEKFYLGGFSNGGFGISRLAGELKNEKGLAGLIFIDGIQDGIGIRETGLPVLIIQGTQDERVPTAAVRQIAEVIGDSGTYIELNSDHFLIMKIPEQVRNAITDWLDKQ